MRLSHHTLAPPQILSFLKTSLPLLLLLTTLAPQALSTPFPTTLLPMPLHRPARPPRSYLPPLSRERNGIRQFHPLPQKRLTLGLDTYAIKTHNIHQHLDVHDNPTPSYAQCISSFLAATSQVHTTALEQLRENGTGAVVERDVLFPAHGPVQVQLSVDRGHGGDESSLLSWEVVAQLMERFMSEEWLPGYVSFRAQITHVDMQNSFEATPIGGINVWLYPWGASIPAQALSDAVGDFPLPMMTAVTSAALSSPSVDETQFEQPEEEEVAAICPICLDDIEVEDDLVCCTMRCGQAFHTGCMRGWRSGGAVGRNKCPVW